MSLNDAINRIDEAIKDQSVPKRVKVVLERVKTELTSKKDLEMDLTTAVYELDEIVNDVNVPMHAKTVIWDIISSLEALKGS